METGVGQESGVVRRIARLKLRDSSITWKQTKKKPRMYTNVYEEHPKVVAELTALLEKYEREGRSAPVMA